MKPPLVLSTLIGGMVVVGAAAVGTAYLGHHPARPPPPPPVAQAAPPLAAPPAVAPPTAAYGPSPSRTAWAPRRLRVHAGRRACPLPVVYHPRRLHRPAPARWSVAQTGYAPPPAYALPPPHRGGYGRPDWRVGWREPRWHGPGWHGPGWPYGPRWAYGPRPAYGPAPGYGWRSW